MSEENTVHRVAVGELRSFIERIENIDAEKKALADAGREVLSEAKSRGYDTKILRKLISLRKKDPTDLAEEEAILEVYREALGM